MTANAEDNTDLNLFDDQFFEQYFGTEILDESLSSDFVLSDVLQHTDDLSSEDQQYDVSTDRREWLVNDGTSKRLRPPRLFEFLFLLLQNPLYAHYASYKDQSQGIFQIHEPEKIANLWQQVKNRQSVQPMTYDKFARAVRWYYKSNIMVKTNTRYTFQFSPTILKELMIDENNNVPMDFASTSQ